MYTRYLVTGATGFLGRTVVEALVKQGAEVYALVLYQDPLMLYLPEGVHVVVGDVTSRASLELFFAAADRRTCVIHCAGIVSLATNPGLDLYHVNVGGTLEIVRQCLAHSVGKLVYVSSVHAIPSVPKGTAVTETDVFSPALVDGDYAESKATATEIVFAAVERGLNASVVFPSGIIGPGDRSGGAMSAMIEAFLAGRLPFAVSGGHDFADVRDVAAGILSCAESGEAGKGYILSGHYITLRRLLCRVRKAARRRLPFICLPMPLARLAAPWCERHCRKKGKPLFFTPYSVAVLSSGARYSREAAGNHLGYSPRPMEVTLRDMTRWVLGEDEILPF